MLPAAGEWTHRDVARLNEKLSAVVTNAVEREAQGRVDPGMYRINPETLDQEAVLFAEDQKVMERRYKRAQERRGK